MSWIGARRERRKGGRRHEIARPAQSRMRLSEALGAIEHELISDGSFSDRRIMGVTSDSRAIEPGFVFVAIRGAREDGRNYIADAIAKGAVLVALDRELEDRFGSRSFSVPIALTGDSRRALGAISDLFYARPSADLDLVGVTGSNGKTTTTYLLEAVFRAAGRAPARIGTNGYALAGAEYEALNTTPESSDLNRMLREHLDSGGDSAALEVSSHALDQGRLYGIRFKSAIFTNLTRDHLDYHKDMDSYYQAKSKLFSEFELGAAIVNIDDRYGAALADAIRESSRPMRGYGMNERASIRCVNSEKRAWGLKFDALIGSKTLPIESSLVGGHNIYNILGAIGAALESGVDHDSIARGVKSLRSAPGRFERIDEGQSYDALVDYAHTEDALSKTLSAARRLAQGRLIALIGCGGDRDRGKRARMGRVASELADILIVTSDNPRTEDPDSIIDDILAGIDLSRRGKESLVRIVDRRDAIYEATRIARAGDLVAICGRGSERYQTIGASKVEFDDRLVARSAIKDHVN